MRRGTETDEIVAATAGDESAFASLTERHRRELHVHCYRMLASFDDAEDAVQETLLRAWRSRDSFDGSALYRAWLHRIATNVCLDMLRRSSRRLTTMQSYAEVPWLQPYPDQLLDEVAPSDDEPDAVAVERETIKLAFLAAMQVLPPTARSAARPRCPRLAGQRDRVGSGDQRRRGEQRVAASPRDDAGAPAGTARGVVRRGAERRGAGAARAVHRRARALRRGGCRRDRGARHPDHDAAEPVLLRRSGGDHSAPRARLRGGQGGDWRLVPTQANRMPPAASFLRRPGDSQFRAFKFDVLRIADGAVAEITTFGPELFPAFGLPPTLERDGRSGPG